MWCNMNKPWRHNAKKKKPDAKDYIIYNPIYIKYKEGNL